MGDPMSTTDTKQRVIGAWAAFATRDRDSVAAVFAPDAEWLAPPHNATAMALDGTSHLVGRDRIVQFLTQEFGTVFVDDVSILFRGVYADGNTVRVREYLDTQRGVLAFETPSLRSPE